MPLDLPYSKFEGIVEQTLLQLIREARGSCLTVFPKRIAKRAGLPPKPVILTLIDYYLQKLERKGWIQFWKRANHAKKYIIYNTSPLWKKAKGNGDRK